MTNIFTCTTVQRVQSQDHKLHKSRDYSYWSLLYSAILRSRADSLHVILHEWIAFYSAFFVVGISTEVVYLQRWHGWCHKNLLPERVNQTTLTTELSPLPGYMMHKLVMLHNHMQTWTSTCKTVTVQTQFKPALSGEASTVGVVDNVLWLVHSHDARHISSC